MVSTHCLRMEPGIFSNLILINLIVLPIQGRALKNGNSAFIDRNWNAYLDQWEFVSDFDRDILELEYNV